MYSVLFIRSEVILIDFGFVYEIARNLPNIVGSRHTCLPIRVRDSISHSNRYRSAVVGRPLQISTGSQFLVFDFESL